MNRESRQKGFTIIELLIASAVFSTILLLCTAGLLYVGRLYYKGLTSSATQEVSRSVIQEITQDFQLSGGYFVQLPTTSGYDGFCIGDHLYTYQINTKINADGSGHALVVRDIPGCAATPDNFATSPAAVQAQWRELLGPNMRVGSLQFSNQKLSLANKVQAMQISLNIISGDDDLINAGLCKGGSGSQFCANSQLVTYAVRRLR